MDDITREVLTDAGSVEPRRDGTKGPEELRRLGQGVAAEESPKAEWDAEGPAAGSPRFRMLDETAHDPTTRPDPATDESDPSAEELAAPGAGPEEPAEPEAEESEPESQPEAGPESDPVAAAESAPEADRQGADGGDAEADGIDAAEAALAVAAEAEAAEVEEVLATGDDDLPPVPELDDAAAVARVLFVLLLSQKEGLSLFRLAQACNTTQKRVEEAMGLLQRQFAELGLPVEFARTGEQLKLLSGPDAFPYLQRLKGVKKQEKLSPAALETLAVIAYRQPVMRGEIEAIRGVKAGPMLRTLLQHKLVRVTGRADVPGRPLQYGTTQHFLERFGLGSLQELPSIKEFKQLG